MSINVEILAKVAALRERIEIIQEQIGDAAYRCEEAYTLASYADVPDRVREASLIQATQKLEEFLQYYANA